MKKHLILFAILLCGLCFTLQATPPMGWTENFAKAQKDAKSTKKPMLILFTGSDWCGWCKKLKADVLDKKVFQDFARQNLILVYCDFPRGQQLPTNISTQNNELRKKFGVKGFPNCVLLDKDGRKVAVFSGYDAKLLSKLKQKVKTLRPAAKAELRKDYDSAKKEDSKKNIKRKKKANK